MDFLLLGCNFLKFIIKGDGIYDKLTSEEVGNAAWASISLF